MPIHLTRTFSELRAEAGADVEEDWAEYLADRSSKTWTDLRQYPVVVVVGAAGIGKTIDFQMEAARMRTENRAAFFIPLNQLQDVGSWKLVLMDMEAEFHAWINSTEIGYFFLDSVDEARLTSHTDFEVALKRFRIELGPYMARMRIAISSRVSDWSMTSVQEIVDRHLTRPIDAASHLLEKASMPVAKYRALAPDVPNTGGGSAPLAAFVVSMDALSNADARRYAQACGVIDAEGFWRAVRDADYEFMVTSPLDLRWMVDIWNERRAFGTYAQLMETNIVNRLREVNPSYLGSDTLQSADQLYEGAMALAAAAEFGGRYYFNLADDRPARQGELNPDAVLPGWSPIAVRRLLATALFDEASLGRVAFHHRSSREYLAGRWVSGQISSGVPFHRLQILFAASPYGSPVLVASRRAALSWAASIKVEAREWVTRYFPELFLFGGDPQSWDSNAADSAFIKFAEASKQTRLMTWFLSAGEFMRIGSALRPGTVASMLADPSAPVKVRSICFQLARYAKLLDCSAIVFHVFQDRAAPPWERRASLDVLAHIGTVEQKLAVLRELKAGELSAHELSAHALAVVDWQGLTCAELMSIFSDAEGDRGRLGAMGKVIEKKLLPAANLPAALLVLEALVISLPDDFSQLRRRIEDGSLQKPWQLYVLPNSLERVLELAPKSGLQIGPVCIRAAVLLETMRDVGYRNTAVLHGVSKSIARHADFRWDVARAISRSKDVRNPRHRLTWEGHCIVSFRLDDVPQLVNRANGLVDSEGDRHLWSVLAIAIAFSTGKCRQRSEILRNLGLGGPDSNRRLAVKKQYEDARANARELRRYRAEDVQEQIADDLTIEKLKQLLLTNLASIQAGTNQGLLVELLKFASHRAPRGDYAELDWSATGKAFGSEIASAFEEGLVARWKTIDPPELSNLTNGVFPWDIHLALAGLRRALSEQSVIAGLTSTEVATAARLAVCALAAPPIWFQALARVHRYEVQRALTPMLIVEVKVGQPKYGVITALAMVLRCEPDVRSGFLVPLLPLLEQDQITHRDTLETLLQAMRDDGVISPSAMAAYCSRKLAFPFDARNLEQNFWLLLYWLGADPVAAWEWFRAYFATVADKGAQVAGFASMVCKLTCVPVPVTEDAAEVLQQIHAFVRAHPPPVEAEIENDPDGYWEPPTTRLRNGIVGLFLNTRGPVGHDGLESILNETIDFDDRQQLAMTLVEHAAMDAAQKADRAPDELTSIGSPFLSNPSTEAQLYEQVLARLEEIRTNIQEGPFSERDLFFDRIPEKFLQRWLAAKLRDTQQKRFGVHREEEVDKGKKTDIQLSYGLINVCIEIKPIDGHRPYSAAELTDTLRTQLVGQYLRGNNSSSGILVLMLIKKKMWRIPGSTKLQNFELLVKYLNGQAQLIKRGAGVGELSVVGIRCVK